MRPTIAYKVARIAHKQKREMAKLVYDRYVADELEYAEAAYWIDRIVNS